MIKSQLLCQLSYRPEVKMQNKSDEESRNLNLQAVTLNLELVTRN